MTGMNDHMTKLEQGRNNHASQSANQGQSYADIVGTTSFSTKVIQTQSPNESLEKFEYTSSEEELRRKLLQAKVTHPAILNSSPDLEEHAKQFYARQVNMSRREIDEGMYVKKLLQPNMVLIKLSDHRFKNYLFRSKKQLRLSNDQTYNDIHTDINNTVFYRNFRAFFARRFF